MIGSSEELKARAVEGWDAFEGHSPHRPYIDAVKIRCAKCGGTASRIEDVGNPWLDAGIVPFSTMGYTTRPRVLGEVVPGRPRPRVFPGPVPQLVLRDARDERHDGRPARRSRRCWATRWCATSSGEEMHKSKGNSIAFDEAAEVFGAEVMRYIYAEQKTGQHLNFPDLHPNADAGPALDAEARRKLLTFWNCYSFFVMYAAADGWTARGAPLR